jgi:DNA-binding PadR family transcriptional regulator
MKHKERFGGFNDCRFSRPDASPDGGVAGGSHGHRHGLGGPHRGGFGRRGRPFDYGDLRLLMLAMIAEQPRHGYDLIKVIEERLGGAYSPSPGVIYPALAMLDEMGLIAPAAAEAARKRYAITDAGLAQLETERARLDAVMARMGQAATEGGGRRGAPAPILRAMENVKLSLRLRIGRGDVGPAEADAIAAALDEAARTIEQT